MTSTLVAFIISAVNLNNCNYYHHFPISIWHGCWEDGIGNKLSSGLLTANAQNPFIPNCLLPPAPYPMHAAFLHHWLFWTYSFAALLWQQMAALHWLTAMLHRYRYYERNRILYRPLLTRLLWNWLDPLFVLILRIIIEILHPNHSSLCSSYHKLCNRFVNL